MNTMIYVPASKPEDWQQLLADPQKHWKKGYSARSLAYCWQEAGGIPRDVKDVLLQLPAFEGLETLLVFPEHQVALPGGKRPSQNDCWVLARTAKDLVSIAVEGKVSEPFGPTINEWLANPSEGKQNRLSFLCAQVGLDTSVSRTVRYQLLHRTASAVMEAKRFHAQYAVMVVHSFSRTADWFEDYREFSGLFQAQADIDKIVSIGTPQGIRTYLAWVSGDERYLEV
jgi:hypothetical protein